MTVSASTRYHDRLKKKRQAIHVARRQLELDDTSYRALLMRAAGVNSSADIMSNDKADAVLDALSKLGFKHKKMPKPGTHPGTPGNIDREPYLQKIEALLADMELPWTYAERIAENITGGNKPESIKRLAWVREQKHLVGIVAALHREKTKRLDKAQEELGQQLARRGLTLEWAREQAIAMDRLMLPWRWIECLETLRMIAAKLEQEP